MKETIIKIINVVQTHFIIFRLFLIINVSDKSPEYSAYSGIISFFAGKWAEIVSSSLRQRHE